MVTMTGPIRRGDTPYAGDYDYCADCGRPTVRVEERIVGYSHRDGHPYRHARYRCPNRRWWNFHTDKWTEIFP